MSFIFGYVQSSFFPPRKFHRLYLQKLSTYYDTYPKFLKNILIHCGFDCESTLSLLNEDAIDKIEKEVDIKKELIKNTIYEKKEGNFKFLIGHKQLILAIPETLAETIRAKKRKTEKKNEVKLDANILGHDVINRINNYMQSRNLDCKVEEEHIQVIDFDEDGPTGRAKVVLKCVFCEIETACTYDKHWHISNYTKHVSSHLKNAEKISEKNGQPSVQQSIEIQRGRRSVLSDVEHVLRLVFIDKYLLNQCTHFLIEYKIRKIFRILI